MKLSSLIVFICVSLGILISDTVGSRFRSSRSRTSGSSSRRSSSSSSSDGSSGTSFNRPRNSDTGSSFGGSTSVDSKNDFGSNQIGVGGSTDFDSSGSSFGKTGSEQNDWSWDRIDKGVKGVVDSPSGGSNVGKSPAGTFVDHSLLSPSDQDYLKKLKKQAAIRRRVRLGRPCYYNSQCHGSGFSGYCHNRYCSCVSWFTTSDDGCVESSGLDCTTDSDCDKSYIPQGGTGKCVDKHCTCDSGYILTDTGCGHNESIAADGLSDWSNGTVVDAVDSPTRNTRKHLRLGDSGLVCSSSSDCPSGTAYTGSCLYGECQCQPGYHTEDGRCENNGATSIKTAALTYVFLSATITYMSAIHLA